MPRTEHLFPTRDYSYRDIPSRESPLAMEAEGESTTVPQLEVGIIHRSVLGVDSQPQPMEPEEVERLLRDPFAELLLKRGTFPLSLRALLAAFDAFNEQPEGLPQQASYLVADGGQIPWSAETADLNRQFRFAVARSRNSDMDVLVSASTVIDSETNFLQLLAWDEANQVFNYYQRLAGTWVWAGNSQHALEPATRGRGPFDSHVNGSLVMKELKAPWNHWHSSRAKIQDTVLEENDPLRSEPLFRNKTEANLLEINVVKPGISRWNRARVAKSLNSDGTLSNVPFLMRQVLETTTANLISCDIESDQVREDTTFQLPSTFFLNADALLGEIGLDPDINPIRVNGKLYLDSLRRYDFALTAGGFRHQGDTFFAFLVPEPAFEDIDVLSTLLERKIITPHFAASLLMVDFPNPIFSARRQHLMQYVPEQVHLTSAGSDLPELMATAMEAVEPNLETDSPEREFLANWRLPAVEWRSVFEQRTKKYFDALVEQVQTEEGFDGFVRLADSRRREFGKRPLAEFDLTLPTTNIPKDSPFLAMHADGTVHNK